MSPRRKFVQFIACAPIALAAGCKINSINSFPSHPASVRVINLMSDGSSVDVAIGGSPTFTAVGPQTLTEYQSFDNVTTSMTVTFSGTDLTITSFSIPLAGEQPYTLAVFGTAEGASAVILAEVQQPLTNGNVQFSVFNAATNNFLVDVYVTAPEADLTDLAPNFFAVGYNGSSLNLAFSPGTYQIRGTRQGTKAVIFDSGAMELPSNVALLMVFYAAGSGLLVNAALVESRGSGRLLNSTQARIKAVNAGSAALEAVNQLQGTTAINSDLGFGAASPYAVGTADSATVSFEAAATPGATLATATAELAAGADYSAVLVGEAGSQQAFILRDSNFIPPGGSARLRFVNAATGTAPISVSVSGVDVASGIALGAASAYINAVAGAGVPVVVSDAATGTALLTLAPDIPAGQTLTVYLIGSPAAYATIVTQDN